MVSHTSFQPTEIQKQPIVLVLTDPRCPVVFGLFLGQLVVPKVSKEALGYCYSIIFHK